MAEKPRSPSPKRVCTESAGSAPPYTCQPPDTPQPMYLIVPPPGMVQAHIAPENGSIDATPGMDGWISAASAPNEDTDHLDPQILTPPERNRRHRLWLKQELGLQTIWDPYSGHPIFVEHDDECNLARIMVSNCETHPPIGLATCSGPQEVLNQMGQGHPVMVEYSDSGFPNIFGSLGGPVPPGRTPTSRLCRTPNIGHAADRMHQIRRGLNHHDCRIAIYNCSSTWLHLPTRPRQARHPSSSSPMRKAANRLYQPHQWRVFETTLPMMSGACL